MARRSRKGRQLVEVGCLSQAVLGTIAHTSDPRHQNEDGIAGCEVELLRNAGTGGQGSCLSGQTEVHPCLERHFVCATVFEHLLHVEIDRTGLNPPAQDLV